MPRSASLVGTEQNCTMWVCHIVHRLLLRSRTQVAKGGGCPGACDGTAHGNHGLTWTHGDTRDCRTCALTSRSAMKNALDTAPVAAQAEKAQENNYGKAEGGVAVTGHSHAAQRAVRARDWTHFSEGLLGTRGRPPKAAGTDGGRSPQEWRKLLSLAEARYTAATILSATGHKALTGAYTQLHCYVSHFPFGTEPLLVNDTSHTDTHDTHTETHRDTHTETHRDTQTDRHTDTHTDTTDTQTHKQTHRQRHRHTDTHTHTQRFWVHC